MIRIFLLLLTLFYSSAFAQTNRLLINGVESEGPITLSNIFRLRVESEEPLENTMVFISGVLAIQRYDYHNNRFGFDVVENTGSNAAEFYLSPKVFPDGEHDLYVSVWSPAGALIREYRRKLTFTNGLPITVDFVKPIKPHFSRNGQLLYQYDSDKSVIPRTMFGSQLSEFTQRPELVQQYKDAGFNTVFLGIGINSVRDIGPTCTQGQFEAAQRVRIDAAKAFCEEHDLLCLADMMDWTYSAAACAPILAQPWAEAAIKNTFEYMKTTGLFVCVDLCDETFFRWGDADQSNARKLTQYARLARGPPVSWTTGPMPSETPALRQAIWGEGPYFSDYLSLGRDVVDWRNSGDPSVDQGYRSMLGATYNIRTDCPFIINVTACSGFSIKFQSSDYITLAEIGYSLTLGATGIKVYSLDTLAWKAQRAVGPGQEGCDPTTNPGRWIGISHAMNAVEELTPLILQPQVQCETAGRWFATRATAGDNGRFWLSVNRLDVPQRAVVPNGYTDGFILGLTGKTAVSGRKQYVTVPAGGWLVMRGL